MNSPVVFTPTFFAQAVNQTLEYAYSAVLIQGEVASFKVNQGKWVFFDLKDEETSISCFMTVWDLRVPLEDGMKIVIRGVPKLTKWGKFSVTVSAIKPVGEGSLKKAYEMLRKKLAKEGLFDLTKKRKIPADLRKIGVISSTQAAGYADFIKIINARWGGMKVTVAHTQVQGLDAPDQIIRALDYFNERGEVQMIAILRGGGSADDLACFNDEALVRAVAASKIPVICGIGHEVDESLCDLACDVRASTPSNAAEMLTPERKEVKAALLNSMDRLTEMLIEEVDDEIQANREKCLRVAQGIMARYIGPLKRENDSKMESLARALTYKVIEPKLNDVQNKMESLTHILKYKVIEPKLNEIRKNMTEILKNIKRALSEQENYVKQKKVMLEALNPEVVLRQGYAILSGKLAPGGTAKIITYDLEITTLIKEIIKRRKDG
ncbi:exodeoxyribonuclease VII large subunit [Candidatus Saccharibacteria bacterium]|nr:exodeoxyribonuclease VII large subunit [Candidatus Saccharibacteria bacterium]